MTVCYLGIGSNLGNRRRNIQLALKKIRQLKDTQVLKVARIIETDPVGGSPAQPKFLNTAIKITTGLSPGELLKQFKIIEKELGRKKTVRWGPRVIDLDILFYGNRVIANKVLKVPHPRVFEREFVIKPLLDILW